MTEITPAILPKNYEDLKNKVAMVKGLVPMVQVDLCDGIFVKSLTWPFIAPPDDGVSDEASLDQNFLNILNEREGMPFWEDIDYELDLMVSDAVKNFDIYTKLGPKRIIFHVDAVGDLGEFKEFIEGIDMYIRDSIEIGLAIKPSTPLENIYPLASIVDLVQVMSNDTIGYQGVTLDEKAYEVISALRERFPDLPIGVDIGVNRETGPKLVDAGATKLAVGSAIFTSNDIIGTIEDFQNL